MAEMISVGKNRHTVNVEAPDGKIYAVRQPTVAESLELDAVTEAEEKMSVRDRAEAIYAWIEKLGLPREVSGLCTMAEMLSIIEALKPKKKP